MDIRTPDEGPMGAEGTPEPPPAADAQPPTARRRRKLSRTTRFEVFKRDQFTCQYCGRKAPEVVLEARTLTADATDGATVRLHVDHVDPLALGGADDILNYVTACEDCNLGKGARPLADDSVIVKKRRQLDELAARREQMEMLFEWQRELGEIAATTLERLANYWEGLAPGWELNDAGRRQLARWIDEFPLDEIMTAMRTAVATYLERDDAGRVTGESWEKAFDKIGGICHVRRASGTEPYLKRLLYIRGILRNLFPDRIDESEALALLKRGARLGFDLDDMQEGAKRARSYYRWRRDMEELIADAEAEDEADARAEETAPPAVAPPRRPAAPAPPPPRSAPAPATAAAAPTTPLAKPDFARDFATYQVTLGDNALVGVSADALGAGTVADLTLPPITVGSAVADVGATVMRATDSDFETDRPAGHDAVVEFMAAWRARAGEPAAVEAPMAAAQLYWATRAVADAADAGAPCATLSVYGTSPAVAGDDTTQTHVAYNVWTVGQNLDADLWRAAGLHEAVLARMDDFPFPELRSIPDRCSHEVPFASLAGLTAATAATVPVGTRIAALGAEPWRTTAASDEPVVDLVTTGRPEVPFAVLVEDLLDDVARPPRPVPWGLGPGADGQVLDWLAAVEARAAAARRGGLPDFGDLVPLPPVWRGDVVLLRTLVVPRVAANVGRALASAVTAAVTLVLAVAAEIAQAEVYTVRSYALGLGRDVGAGDAPAQATERGADVDGPAGGEASGGGWDDAPDDADDDDLDDDFDDDFDAAALRRESDVDDLDDDDDDGPRWDLGDPDDVEDPHWAALERRREQEYRRAAARDALRAQARRARLRHLAEQGLDPYDFPDDGVYDDDLGDALESVDFAADDLGVAPHGPRREPQPRDPWRDLGGRPAGRAHPGTPPASAPAAPEDPSPAPVVAAGAASSAPPADVSTSASSAAHESPSGPPDEAAAAAAAATEAAARAAAAAAARLAARRRSVGGEGARYRLPYGFSSLDGVRIADLGAGSTVAAEGPVVRIDGIETVTTLLVEHAPADAAAGRPATVTVTATWPRPTGDADAAAINTSLLRAQALFTLVALAPASAVDALLERPEVVAFASLAARGGASVLAYRLSLPGEDLAADLAAAVAWHEMLAETVDVPWYRRLVAPSAGDGPLDEPSAAARLPRLADEDLRDADAVRAALTRWPAGVPVALDGATGAPAPVLSLVAGAARGDGTPAPLFLFVEDWLPVLDGFQSAAAKAGRLPAGTPPNAIRADERDVAIRAWLAAVVRAFRSSAHADRPPCPLAGVVPPRGVAGGLRLGYLLELSDACDASDARAVVAERARRAAADAASSGIVTELGRRLALAGWSPTAPATGTESARPDGDEPTTPEAGPPARVPPLPAADTSGSGAPTPRSPTTGSPTAGSMSRPGRNAPCPCGSGKKFKRCCGDPRGVAGGPRGTL